MGSFSPAAGDGFTSIAVAGVQEFFVAGPFAAGSVLRRIFLDVTILADVVGGDLRVAFTVGASAVANLASFQAGSSVLRRSDSNIAGVPCFAWRNIVEMHARMQLFPGVRFAGGSNYVIVGVENASASASTLVNAALEIVRSEQDIALRTSNEGMQR